LQIDVASEILAHSRSYLNLGKMSYSPSFNNSQTRIDTNLNDYIEIVSDKLKVPVDSAVLIIKKGPAGGLWEKIRDIDDDAVARTIWWYHTSGNDVSQVFGEREFSRYLKSNLW
jgi:hypothetical protein